MAVYWHPFLVEMLRWEYGNRVEVRDEVPLGDMPSRLDMLLLLLDAESLPGLPFPFCYLGPTTLVEFKGPDDSAGQGALAKLLSKTLAFQAREQTWSRPGLTLWLIASRFAGDLSLPHGAEVTRREEVGPGVIRGVVDKFPVCLVDLNALPVTPATLPLVMVAKGAQERVLVEYLVEHAREYPRYVQVLPLLHFEMLTEVLMEREMTLEEIGIDGAKLVGLLGASKLAQTMTPEQMKDFLRGAGLGSIIRAAGIESIIQAAGPERVREALERMEQDGRQKGDSTGRGH